MLGTFTRGGQTAAHQIRMFRQVVKLAFIVSLFAGGSLFIYRMSHVHSVYYMSIWYYFKALFCQVVEQQVSVSRAFWSNAMHQSYSSPEILLNATEVLAYTEKINSAFSSIILQFFKASSVVSCYAFGGVFAVFHIKGSILSRRKQLSGTTISPAWKTALSLRLRRRASNIVLGKLPLVKNTETQHIMVSGGTGSGKTNCFHHILPQVRKNKQRAIIVDSSGSFVSRYYREGKDVLLNPFDERTQLWSPWAECHSESDYQSLSDSFIPLSNNEADNFWRTAARSVFNAVLQKTKMTKSNAQLAKYLLQAPLNDLYELIKDTTGASYLDPSSERTASSIRAVTSSCIEPIHYLKDTDQPFSIREWVQRKDDDSWLFLYTKVPDRAAVTPLLSVWLTIAIRSLMGLNEDLSRRLWFVIDELASLKKLNNLESFVTEGRKFGGCGLFAFQTPAQLEDIYGFNQSRIMIGNSGTKIVFSERDPATAKKIAQIFGEREIEEHHEGISYGAHEMRDGVNLSTQKKMMPVVAATEILSLQRNEAFIKLPDATPISRVKLKFIK